MSNTFSATKSTTQPLAYCTQKDVEEVFGKTNVKVWSNLENDSTVADQKRIAAAIAYADAQIDKRFRGSKYVIPITVDGGGTPTDITYMAARLAGVWLYESRATDRVEDDNDTSGDGVLAHRGHVNAEIDRYLAGQDQLDAVLVGDGTVAPFAVE